MSFLKKVGNLDRCILTPAFIALATGIVSALPANAASLGDPLDTVNNATNVSATWKWGNYQVGTHK